MASKNSKQMCSFCEKEFSRKYLRKSKEANEFICLECLLMHHHEFREKYFKNAQQVDQKTCQLCGKSVGSFSRIWGTIKGVKNAKEKRYLCCNDCVRTIEIGVTSPTDLRRQKALQDYRRKDLSLEDNVENFFNSWRYLKSDGKELPYELKKIMWGLVIKDLHGIKFFKHLVSVIDKNVVHKKSCKQIKKRADTLMVKFLGALRKIKNKGVASEFEMIVFYEIGFNRSQISGKEIQNFLLQLSKESRKLINTSLTFSKFFNKNPLFSKYLYAGWKKEKKENNPLNKEDRFIVAFRKKIKLQPQKSKHHHWQARRHI